MTAHATTLAELRSAAELFLAQSGRTVLDGPYDDTLFVWPANDVEYIVVTEPDGDCDCDCEESLCECLGMLLVSRVDGQIECEDVDDDVFDRLQHAQTVQPLEQV